MMTIGGLRRVPVRIHWYHTLSSQIENDWRDSPLRLRWLKLRARIPFSFITHAVANSNAAKQDEIDKLLADQPKKESEPLTKDQVIQTLTESFAALRTALENARPQGLAREASFFGTPTTRRGVLTYLDVHIGEHLGQAIAYARMNGIVPPWSK